MSPPATLALLLVLGLGCGGAADPQPETKPEPKPAPPSTPKVEPQRIELAHILISFAGTKTSARRSKAEAEKLAGDVLARVRKGEDFDKLMKDYSDDPGVGVYRLTNRGVRSEAGEYPRTDMVPAFGNVGFQLDVGQVGMSTFDAKDSPYGWHIIKRLK
jgi:parvulin-like peptidyl-prolyl isomerase